MQAMLLVGVANSSVPVTARAVLTWRHVAGALAPVIGELGVVALYDRSLRLAGAEFPWLLAVPKAPQMGASLDHLRQFLAVKEAEDAAAVAAATSTHLGLFTDLLAGLIGPSLSERLLRPVWSDPAAPPTEETAP